MRVITLDVPGAVPFRLVPIGDIHSGAAGCREDLLAETVEAVNPERDWWLGLGDYCEFIRRGDPRFEVGTLAEWVTVPMLADLARHQMDRVGALLQPRAERCLGLIKGNHEDSIAKHTERDVMADLCAMLGARRLGYGCILRLRFPDAGGTALTMLVHHGSGGGAAMSSKVTKLEKLLDRWQVDVAMFGHHHREVGGAWSNMHITESGRMQARRCLGLVTGTYLETYQVRDDDGNYGEVKAYPPATVGSPYFVISPADIGAPGLRGREAVRLVI